MNQPAWKTAFRSFYYTDAPAPEDPELLAEAKKRDLTIDPTSGERMQQIIDEAYRLPAATVETVRRALTTP